jgi:hypothetical protein
MRTASPWQSQRLWTVWEMSIETVEGLYFILHFSL